MIQGTRDEIVTILNQVDRLGRRDNLSLYLNKLCRQIDDPRAREHDAKEETLRKLLQGYTADTLALYRHAFGEWRRMHDGGAETLCFEMETTAPLIVGKGEANVHEFGISLQAPWSAPVIPGSAVKGVLSAFAVGNGGEAWQRGSGHGQDGSFGVAMFGGRDSHKQELAGGVRFMDAWWLPSSGTPFMEDIINVHYRSYYQQQGVWPHGMDSPVPNKFLALRPGERFLFVVRGPQGWCNLAREMLVAAAAEQGFGAKTRVGYGRLRYLKTDADLRAEIPGLDALALAQLFLVKSGSPLLRESFAAECRCRPYTPELHKLFMKFRPAAVLLATLREKSPLQWTEAGAIRKQFTSQLPAADIDTTDPDVQAIFSLCLPLAPNGAVAGTWLARFAPTADDLLAQKTAAEIEVLLFDYAGTWPPLTDFGPAIARHPHLSEQERENCLAALALRLEERG